LSTPHAANPTDLVTAFEPLVGGEANEVLHALTAHLEMAHATFTSGQAALVDHYRTASQLLANIRLHLANPSMGSGPYDDLIDSTDRALLAALNQGKTRAAAAAAAGIGRHETNDRMRRMYDLTGSTMQFEFGRAAVSRLWVPADPGSPRSMT